MNTVEKGKEFANKVNDLMGEWLYDTLMGDEDLYTTFKDLLQADIWPETIAKVIAQDESQCILEAVESAASAVGFRTEQEQLDIAKALKGDSHAE